MGRKLVGLFTAMALAGMTGMSGGPHAESAPKPGMPFLAELYDVIAKDERGPNVDALSEASCAVNKGWIAVFVAFILALDQQRQAKAIAEDTDRKLSIWTVELQNYIADTANVEGACRAIITARKAYGF